MKYPQKIDLHIHTIVSDGTDTPAQLLDKVRDLGLEMFAISDHDDVKGCRIMRELLSKDDPLFLPGAEFSCRDEEGKYHVLGYGYDADSDAMTGLIGEVHQLRIDKVVRRLDLLETSFGFHFSKEDIDDLLTLDNPGKPHIGNMMVKYGYAESRDEAIRNYINHLKYTPRYLDPKTAIENILAGGGIPILAHPAYGDGDQLILGDEMIDRLKKLMSYGLKGVEAFYSGFTPKLTEMMLDLARQYDLYVTAGSDYHGTNKTVMLGDTGHMADYDMPEGMKKFFDDVIK